MLCEKLNITRVGLDSLLVRSYTLLVQYQKAISLIVKAFCKRSENSKYDNTSACMPLKADPFTFDEITDSIENVQSLQYGSQFISNICKHHEHSFVLRVMYLKFDKNGISM